MCQFLISQATKYRNIICSALHFEDTSPACFCKYYRGFAPQGKRIKIVFSDRKAVEYK
jgi:hypothetical protein